MPGNNNTDPKSAPAANDTFYPTINNVFANVSLPAAVVYAYYAPGYISLTGNNGNTDFVAYEFSLAYCVQTLQTDVTEGIAVTDVLGIETEFENTTTAMPSMRYNDTLFYITTQPDIYLMMTSMFNGVWSRYSGGSDTDESVTLDSTIGVAAMRIAAAAEGFAGLERVWQNVATSMTNDIRSRNDTQIVLNGSAYNPETYVAFRWPWMLGLVLVDVAGLIFLVLVIVINGRRRLFAWKSSSIPTLYALAPEDRKLLNGLREPEIMEEEAERLTMSSRGVGREARLFVM